MWEITEVALAMVCRQCHDEGNEGTLAPWPCLAPVQPPYPGPNVLSLEQTALEANPVHWGTLRLVAPLTG